VAFGIEDIVLLRFSRVTGRLVAWSLGLGWALGSKFGVEICGLGNFLVGHCYHPALRGVAVLSQLRKTHNSHQTTATSNRSKATAARQDIKMTRGNPVSLETQSEAHLIWACAEAQTIQWCEQRFDNPQP